MPVSTTPSGISHQNGNRLPNPAVPKLDDRAKTMSSRTRPPAAAASIAARIRRSRLSSSESAGTTANSYRPETSGEASARRAT
jgi:hypothetical protein